MNATLRQIMRVAERLEAASLRRRRDELAGEIAALEVLLEAARAKHGQAAPARPPKPDNGRAAPYCPSGAKILEERIATRLGLHQPASAKAIAEDLKLPKSDIQSAIEGARGRFEPDAQGLWRLKPRGEPQ